MHDTHWPGTDVAEELATLLTPSRPVDRDGDGERLGGKGAALGRLVASGYPVPATGVVTTASYRRMAAEGGLMERLRPIVAEEGFRAEEVDALYRATAIPIEVADSIADLGARVGRGGPVAVRSSATVEDLHGSSFAGQYQSFLNIDSTDREAVLEAVRGVWASLWHPAPTAYRRAFDTPEDDVAMAVVIMEMIPATTAGVVFTVDPGGDADSSRVEAVEGLGEALVSGAETPSAWVVPRGDDDEDLPEAARRALELSLDVEARFGVPQDTEWAAADGDVYLVQARPITVLDVDDGFDSPVDDHELTTAGIVEMVPGVLPPLVWELNHFILGEAFRSFLDNQGVLRGTEAEQRPFVRRVRGRVAIDFDQLREAAAGIRGAVEQLEAQYFGEPAANDEVDAANVGLRERLRGLRQDLTTLSTRRVVTEQADVVIEAVEQLRAKELGPDLDGWSDHDVLAYAQRLIDLAARGLAAELGVAATAAAEHHRLETLLARYLGPDVAPSRVQRVTAGMVGDVVRSRAASAAIFAGPTWVELGTAPPDRARSTADPKELREELFDELRALPGWTRRRILTGQFVDVRLSMIRRAVTETIEQSHRREAAKAAVLHLGGEVRRAMRELGRRFVSRNLLPAAEDVELLSTAEIAAAIAGDPSHRDDELRRRRNWISRYEAEGPLPLRFRGEPDREPAPLPEGDVLTGWASSPGRYHGRAQVLTSPTQTLDHGAVLVAQTTDASWSPVFVRAGAVIVEQGGPLSHAAILARELGLPAVLNIEGATRVLDGCLVTVDGDGGSVVIEDRGADS